MSGGNSNLILPGEDRKGWFKLIVPAINEIFGHMWAGSGQQATFLPFIYGKLDPDQTAFDTELSQPMYAIDRVCLVQMEQSKKKKPGEPVSKAVSVNIIGLSVISSEQEGRCYMPTALVTCILPVKPVHPLVDSLLIASTESHLVTPSVQETSSILSMPETPQEDK